MWLDGKIIFHNLAIYNNQHLLNGLQNLPQLGLEFCQILNKPSKYWQNYKILPKWRNFAKRGHTAAHNSSRLSRSNWMRALSCSRIWHYFSIRCKKCYRPRSLSLSLSLSLSFHSASRVCHWMYHARTITRSNIRWWGYIYTFRR